MRLRFSNTKLGMIFKILRVGEALLVELDGLLDKTTVQWWGVVWWQSAGMVQASVGQQLIKGNIFTRFYEFFFVSDGIDFPFRWCNS